MFLVRTSSEKEASRGACEVICWTTLDNVNNYIHQTVTKVNGDGLVFINKKYLVDISKPV